MNRSFGLVRSGVRARVAALALATGSVLTLGGCSCTELFCNNLLTFAMVVNSRIEDCCNKPTSDAQMQCLGAVQAEVTSTLVQIQAAREACDANQKKRMEEIWDKIIERWSNPTIFIPVATASLNANTWPLVSPDEVVTLDFVAPRLDACKTQATLVVGEKIVMPDSAGKQSVKQSEQSSTDLVPTIVNSAQANTALTACTYQIESGAAIDFKVGLLPAVSIGVSGSIELVGLSGDVASGWSSLVGNVTMKIDAPQGQIVLKSDSTNPDNKLSVDHDGNGWLRVAMSVDSEYPYRPGMNGQVFWFTWPVELRGGGTSLAFNSRGAVEATDIVPITDSLKRGVLKAGRTFPRLPTRPDPTNPTEQCATGLGNPDMADRADWIMQGILGSLNGYCTNPYQ